MAVFLLIITLVLAVANDLRFHKIPNWLTYPAMACGVFLHTATGGIEGFLFGIEGIGVGIGILIVPYAMGGMGAGDAKLMGAVGSLLGPKSVFVAFLFTAMIGGIYAFFLLILRGFFTKTLGRYAATLKTFVCTKQFIYIPPSKDKNRPKLYYGVAIALGTLASVIWHKGI